MRSIFLKNKLYPFISISNETKINVSKSQTVTWNTNTGTAALEMCQGHGKGQDLSLNSSTMVVQYPKHIQMCVYKQLILMSRI